jgi:hypothetical protein
MALYRLLKGGLVLGAAGVDAEGKPTQARFFYANDPLNNIVESDANLEEQDPLKFKEVKNPQSSTLPDRSTVDGDRPSPPPPTDADYAEAKVLSSGDPTALREYAQRLMERADELDSPPEEPRE